MPLLSYLSILLISSIQLPEFTEIQKPQFSDQRYKQYKIEFDDLQNKNFLIDTILGTEMEIPNYLGRAYPGDSRFVHGLVYTRCGDMKALMNLKGKPILEPCHYIRFYAEDSLIDAYICGKASWIFLNFNTDTLSMGPSPGQSPILSDSFNIVVGGTRDAPALGYLGKDARWKIKPQFEEALPFENGQAKVKLNGLWGLIDTKGQWIIEPRYTDSDF
ncbi:MAG: WG repeat-containing protein [Bacteroidetes bacterium]|nr:MAG: WG repeat-containing protein [Bacteroidota bacterium]